MSSSVSKKIEEFEGFMPNFLNLNEKQLDKAIRKMEKKMATAHVS